MRPEFVNARICRLTLSNFRSYHAASIAVAGDLVVLVGPNGTGKTNLLEAISLLSPGRGLRRAEISELAFNEGDGSWAVSAEVDGALGLATLGTGVEAPSGAEAALLRKYRIDREPAGSAAAFADHLRVVWLVPAMDGLFAGPASERRRFLDRLVLAVDAAHAARVSALERTLRSRNRLLENPRPDAHWLDAVEHETAEIAVAVAAARAETVRRLAAALAARRAAEAAFPAAEIALEGWMETLLLTHPAEVRRAHAPLLTLLTELTTAAAAAGQLRPGTEPRRAAALTMETVMFVAQSSGAPPDADNGTRPVTAEEIWDFCARGITS